jgi:ABC-type sugar transport system substrate-binding protein
MTQANPRNDVERVTGTTRGAFLRRTAAMGASVGIVSSVLAACGGDSSATAESTTTADQAATPASGGTIASKYDKKTIGVVHLTSADENESTLVKALKEATKRAGLDWTFREADSQGDQAKAQAAMTSFITQKVDAIIPLVVSARLIQKELADAKAANIPVFGMWTFSELDPNLLLDYTPIPAADASALAGYMFSDLYLQKPQGDIKVALVNTDLDILRPRNATVRGLAALYPRIKIVDSADIDLKDVVGSATNITNGFLSKHGDLAALWTSYPPTGPAAASAVMARNKAKQVRVYTHVAGSAGVKAIADPANPLQAMPWLDFDWQSYNVVGFMLEHFSGKQVDRLSGYEDVVPFKFFNKASVKDGAAGKGVAAGIGWTLLDGVWKTALVDGWKTTFAS